MADTWYYAQNGQQYGPVSGSQLQQLAAAGNIQPADLVWQEGMANWAPAGSITNLIPAHRMPAPAPVVAPSPAAIHPFAPAEMAPSAVAPHYEPYEVERPRRRKQQGMSAGAIAGLVGGIVGV